VSPDIATTTRRKQDVFSHAMQQAAVSLDIQPPPPTVRQAVSFNHSSLFLDFLAGNQTYQCTPWSNPTYNLFGWQRLVICSRMKVCAQLPIADEDTEWEKYGVGKNPTLATIAWRIADSRARRSTDVIQPSAQGIEGLDARPALCGPRWRPTCHQLRRRRTAPDGRGDPLSEIKRVSRESA